MEEAHNPKQDSQMQKRRSGRGKGRPLEDMQPEEADIREKKARGRGEEDCMGSPSSAIGQGSKVKEGNKVGAGHGRGHRGKGRRRQAGNQERSCPPPAGKRRGRKTMKRQVQYAERAYNEEMNVDIRKIIQQLEEEVTQE